MGIVVIVVAPVEEFITIFRQMKINRRQSVPQDDDESSGIQLKLKEDDDESSATQMKLNREDIGNS